MLLNHELDDRLYITDNTNLVKIYDIQYYETNDPNFTYAGSIEIEVDGEDKDAIGVAIYNDGQGTKYLYTAGYAHPEDRHGFLVRTDPNNPDRPGGRVGVNLGTGRSAVGLAVDEDTGLLYVTTYHGTEDDSIQVYDPLNWPSDPCDISPTQIISDGENYISGPAGLVVGPQYLPTFAVEKVDNVLGCSSPHGQQIEYTISVDYQWGEFGYIDPNIVESIKIVDYHPREADFTSACPDTGLYEYDDPNGGRYTWTLTDANSFGRTQYFELVVQSQNERLTPGAAIENNVEVTATVYEHEHVSKFTLQTCVCYDTDFDTDGVVSYPDFAIFADAWLSDPCDGNWNSSCDLVADNTIDIYDLTDFAKEWLWTACDPMEGMPLMGGGGDMDGMSDAESIPMGEDSTQQQTSETEPQPQSEPSIEEQIEQIKYLLDWLYEVKDQVEDKDACIGIVTSLEEMLKELEDSQ
jgi:hypothetical protein